MKRWPQIIFLTMLSLVMFMPRPLCAQVEETAIVDEAGQVLRQIMAIPMKEIPASMLADAQGIAIIPDLIKGGFIVGVRHGRGVVVVRDEQGHWQPPVFVSLTGGSVGWQVGLQATDVILVFKTKNSVRGLMRGKFTLGADAAAAAGPVGRQAAAATDARLRAEIYSYSRSRGLFAGVSLDGSALQIDRGANAAYYGSTDFSGAPATPGQPIELPPSAGRLLEQIACYTTGPVSPAPVAFEGPVLQPGPPPADAETLRRQLAENSQKLHAMLDDQWRRFLALPQEVYMPKRSPSPDALGQSLHRYNTVLKDPQYRRLAQRPEFLATYELLAKYVDAQAPRTARTLTLPPPPR